MHFGLLGGVQPRHSRKDVERKKCSAPPGKFERRMEEPF